MRASSGSSEYFAAGDISLILTFTDACLRLASSILTSPVVRQFSSFFLLQIFDAGSAAGITTIIIIKFGGSARVSFIGNWPKGLSWASGLQVQGSAVWGF
jgi:hypothetical protein